LFRASTCAPPSFPACPGGVAPLRTALATNRAVAAAYDPGAVETMVRGPTVRSRYVI